MEKSEYGLLQTGLYFKSWGGEEKREREREKER
jgi:hypothetical protein